MDSSALCTVIFVLACAFSLAAFALTWFGPWTAEVSAPLQPRAVCHRRGRVPCGERARPASAAGEGPVRPVARCAPWRSLRWTVASSSVTRDAIAPQASHIVEADGTLTAARVRVDAKARGHVRVHVRVLPHETVDVVAKGAELHEDLMDGLAIVCGDKVEDVSLEFVEPESVTLAGADDDAEATETPAKPAAKAPAPDTTSEITVSMSAPREPEPSLRLNPSPIPTPRRRRRPWRTRRLPSPRSTWARRTSAPPEPTPAAPEPGPSADEGRYTVSDAFRDGVSRLSAWVRRHLPRTGEGLLGCHHWPRGRDRVLAVGPWPLVVIAIFVFVGVAAGQVLDGDPRIVNTLRHLFNRNSQ